jgi:chitinase
MKNACKWLCLAMVLCIAYPAMSQKKEIIGYYPSWKWRSRDNLVNPGRIPYDKLTIINYAFFYPLPDGRLVGRDTVGDGLILRGERDLEKGGYKPGTALTELAHRHGVKVLLSLGGWEDSNNFPEVAASESKRAQFAHSCLEQIRIYGFDGIDIDWEYPGYADHKGKPEDKQNFTQLLQIVRDSLIAYGGQTGREYLLTAALPAVASGLTNYEMDKVAGLLDQLNVMTYDFNGPWDAQSGHNSPLYPPGGDDSLRNIDAALKLYTVTYGIPAAKVNLGVPFYGHTYTQCTSLHASHRGSDTLHFSAQGCFYYDIVQQRDTFVRFWDDRAKVPYLVSASWNMLVSYDDEESVGHKAQYVLDQNACGLIIWEITGDYLPTGKTPLLDVIYSKFSSMKSNR